MRRYVDFRAEDWNDRTDTRMQAARWSACMEGIGERAPFAGVLEHYPEDVLWELILEGWVAFEGDPALLPDQEMRAAARRAVMKTLAEDMDCLASEEYLLVERMLIGDGDVPLETLGEMEAAYTLRMRLWCDLGLVGEQPVARLDPQLVEPLGASMIRREHRERRGRIFIFEGMLHAILYLIGTMDERMPNMRFIEEVLQAPVSPETERLARNFLEATFDTYEMGRSLRLVHEALADPEDPYYRMGWADEQLTQEVDPGQLAASMNGLLPEEAVPDEMLQRALLGALRPEYEPDEVASDLRFLAKQDVPIDTMQRIMASTLTVLPTEHMDGALRELRHRTKRWIHRDTMPPPQPGAGSPGLLN